MSTLLKLEELTKSFGQVKAVDELCLSIREGTCFGLLGPNGAGKSTTIECIQQLIKKDSGKIIYRGRELKGSDLADFGIQFQNTALPAKLKVGEVLEFFSQLYGATRSKKELISLCQLEPFINQYHDKISGGQRQRLLLAVSLCHNPKVLMLDEPTTGLDPQARRNLWDLVKEIKAVGTTVILTTHYMEEAFELCDEIGIIDQGKIIAQGEPKKLLQHYFDESVIEIPRASIEDQQVLLDLFSHIQTYDKFYAVTVKNLNQALFQLSQLNLDLAGISIRQKNLEDLFIHLTGERLRK